MSSHEATHALPISNGFSHSERPGEPPDVTVWCGRCHEAFEPDLAWAERYFAARRRTAESSFRRGRVSAAQHQEILDGIAKSEAVVGAALT